MLNLKIIIASTRPGRVGAPVARWVLERARHHDRFNASFADLAEVKLPLLDEPKHPRLGAYEHAHTKAWSAIVKEADAFVIVTPEYNFGAPPALLNALDYLYNEWNYKPVSFVSYGGISGGLRSVQMTKKIVTTLKMMPIVEAVTIPFVANHMKDGELQSSEQLEKSASAMLDELHRWATALKPMRSEV